MHGLKTFFTCKKENWLYDKKWLPLKRSIRHFLKVVFGLKPWHEYTIYDKKYINFILDSVSEFRLLNNRKGMCVEIGCGLGDIIGNIDGINNKIGFDLSPDTIRCAKLLHPFTRFRVGSFEEVAVGDIEILILVGFMHGINPDDAKRKIGQLMTRNNVHIVCFDTYLHENDDYPHVQSGAYLFGNNYHLARRSRGYYAAGRNRRYIEFWKKNHE